MSLSLVFSVLRNVCMSLVNYDEFNLSYLCIPADASIAASLHLFEDPTSGFGSSCLSHIARSHGKSFWQLLPSELASPFLSQWNMAPN